MEMPRKIKHFGRVGEAWAGEARPGPALESIRNLSGVHKKTLGLVMPNCAEADSIKKLLPGNRHPGVFIPVTLLYLIRKSTERTQN